MLKLRRMSSFSSALTPRLLIETTGWFFKCRSKLKPKAHISRDLCYITVSLTHVCHIEIRRLCGYINGNPRPPHHQHDNHGQTLEGQSQHGKAYPSQSDLYRFQQHGSRGDEMLKIRGMAVSPSAPVSFPSQTPSVVQFDARPMMNAGPSHGQFTPANHAELKFHGYTFVPTFVPGKLPSLLHEYF